MITAAVGLLAFFVGLFVGASSVIGQREKLLMFFSAVSNAFSKGLEELHERIEKAGDPRAKEAYEDVKRIFAKHVARELKEVAK